MAGTNDEKPPPTAGRNFSQGGIRRDTLESGRGGPARLSLESVERVLRDEAAAAGRAIPTASAAPSPAIPPPLFGVSPAAPPPPAITAPPAATTPISPAAPSRLAELVQADGSVDIEAVYRLGRVPDTALSAELLLKALRSLPKDVPSSARRAAVQMTVTTLGQAAGATSEGVIQDALLRRKRLEQYLDVLKAEVEHKVSPVNEEIRRLEAALEEKRVQVQSERHVLDVAQASCGARMDALNEIVTLLQEPNAPPIIEVVADEELPPFMREDSVRRLVGLPEVEAV